MTLHRFLKGLKSIHRFSEIWLCLRKSKAPVGEILGYLQFRSLIYPYKMCLKNGLTLELDNWQDLTTAWVVFFGNEYILDSGDDIVVDLGANIGAFALHAAYTLPEARIFAIEPFPSTFDKLCENVRANDLFDRIKCLNAASVGKSRVVYMDVADNIPSHSRKTDASAGVEVEGLSLRDITDRFEITNISFLKVDIEGAEYEFFEKTLRQDLKCVDRIGLEYHCNGSAGKMFSTIQKVGFKLGRHLKRGNSGLVEFIRTTTPK